MPAPGRPGRRAGILYQTGVCRALIDALDHLFFQMAPELYRVLIVDDSPVQVGVSALYLKQSGMKAFIKSVNDTHGHPAEDRLLKSLAHLLVRDCAAPTSWAATAEKSSP